jgi:hypothetical protein
VDHAQGLGRDAGRHLRLSPPAGRAAAQSRA